MSAVKEENSKILLSSKGLCEVLGVSRETLSNWESQGCPKSGRGWWPLADVLRWRGLVDGGDSKVSGKTPKEEKLIYETRIKQLQAEALAMKNAINSGEYIERDEVVSELSRFFIVLKKSLTGLSGKILTEVGHYIDSQAARALESMVKDIINDALEQMSVDGVYHAKKSSKLPAAKRMATRTAKKSKTTRKS